jgi:hypothetical protein
VAARKQFSFSFAGLLAQTTRLLPLIFWCKNFGSPCCARKQLTFAFADIPVPNFGLLSDSRKQLSFASLVFRRK